MTTLKTDPLNKGPDTPQTMATQARSTFAGLLRIGGALLVVAAMCSHLLEGWEHWSSLSRYYAMLGGTAILSFAGFAMSYFLKENKSARVFFGLGLLSVVANITTLAGMLQSVVQWDYAVIQTDVFANWVFNDGVSLATTIGSAVLVLLPLTWFAFRIFSRDYASKLLLCFAATNALILIPIRESFGVGMLIAVALALPILFWNKYARDNVAFKTREAMFALATLFAPAAIMLGRLLWLYEADTLLLWMLTVVALIVNRLLGNLLESTNAWRHVGSVSYILLAITLGALSANLLDAYVAKAMILPILGLTSGLLIWEKGRDYAREVFTFLGMTFMLLAAFANILFYDSVMASVGSAVLSLTAVLIGYIERNNIVMLFGGLSLLASTLPRAWELIELVDFTNWITLSVIGVVVILAGAMLERLRNPTPELTAPATHTEDAQ